MCIVILQCESNTPIPGPIFPILIARAVKGISLMEAEQRSVDIVTIAK